MYLSDKQVAERYSVSTATVWRWAKETPGFPAPVKLSPGCSRWRVADLLGFEGVATEAAPAPAPAAAKRGRGRPRKSVAI